MPLSDDDMLPPTTTRALIIQGDQGKCVYCDAEVGDKAHLDHVVPLASGGEDVAHNIATSCQECNLRKSGDDLPRPQRNKIISMLFVRNHEAGIDSFGPVREVAKQRKRRLDAMDGRSTGFDGIDQFRIEQYKESPEHKEWLEELEVTWAAREQALQELGHDPTWEHAASELQRAFDFLESIEYPEDPPETKKELAFLQRAHSLADEIEAHVSDLQYNELEDGWN